MPRSAFRVPVVDQRFSVFPIIAAAALLFGCSEPNAPNEALSSRPRAIIVIDGRIRGVLNVQLRSVEDPNIIDDPNIRPHGNLQLKVYENADGTFVLGWKGMISNPAGESFTGFSLTQVGIDRPALLIALGEVDGRTPRIVEPDDSGLISADLAAALLSQEPDGGDRPGIPPDIGDFVVRFYSVERPLGALIGKL